MRGTDWVRKFYPLIVGSALGVAAAVVGKVPPVVAEFGGLRVLSSHAAYTIGALVAAYLFARDWRKAFAVSSLTIIAATVVYYAIIASYEAFGVGFTEGYVNILKGLVGWCVFGVFCGGLAATSARVAACGVKWLSLADIFATYAGVAAIALIYRQRAGAFSVVLTLTAATVLCVVALKNSLAGRL